MNKPLIIVAIKEESQGLIEATGHNVVYTGMGMVSAAAKCAEAIIKFKPTSILNLGTTGSFSVPVGSLVECVKYVRRDQVVSFLDGYYYSQKKTDLPSVVCGTADFITHELDSLKQYDVMDMEAYALAKVCHEYKVPFNSIKYVTDSSGEDFEKSWKENLSKAARALSDVLKTPKLN